MYKIIQREGIGDVKFISAKRVPILKFDDYLNKISCDININVFLGIVNSDLFKAYSNYDERFRIMGYFIKEWAKKNKIQGGDTGFLTSYAYLNMIILYLQIVIPPVLPKLQKLHLSNENAKSMISYSVPYSIVHRENIFEVEPSILEERMESVPTNVYFERDLAKVKEHMAKEYGQNSMSVGELISG